jgi:hypothetical protein
LPARVNTLIEIALKEDGDKMGPLAKSVVVREVRLKRRENSQVNQRKTEVKK